MCVNLLCSRCVCGFGDRLRSVCVCVYSSRGVKGAVLCLFLRGQYCGPSSCSGPRSQHAAVSLKVASGPHAAARALSAKSVWAHAHDTLNTNTHTHTMCVSVRMPKNLLSKASEWFKIFLIISSKTEQILNQKKN